MAEVVPDANVLVAWFDAADALHAWATEVVSRLQADGHRLALLDVTVGETVSVLCRRAAERRKDPADLAAALGSVREWVQRDEIRWVARHAERLVNDILDVVEGSRGLLNFNDGLLAVLQREGMIGEVASFDEDFDLLPDFRRLK